MKDILMTYIKRKKERTCVRKREEARETKYKRKTTGRVGRRQELYNEK